MCRESGTTFSRPGNYSYFGMRNYDFERTMTDSTPEKSVSGCTFPDAEVVNLLIYRWV